MSRDLFFFFFCTIVLEQFEEGHFIEFVLLKMLTFLLFIFIHPVIFNNFFFTLQQKLSDKHKDVIFFFLYFSNN